jgi:hypothetical protein
MPAVFFMVMLIFYDLYEFHSRASFYNAHRVGSIAINNVNVSYVRLGGIRVYFD